MAANRKLELFVGHQQRTIDIATIPSCTLSYHHAELPCTVGLPCSKPQMTTLMRVKAEQHMQVISQSRDLNIIIKAFPVPLLEQAEGDALARDADPQPLQGLAPLLPCCMPPAQPLQFLRCFCWHWTLQSKQKTIWGLRQQIHSMQRLTVTYLASSLSSVPVTVYAVAKYSI